MRAISAFSLIITIVLGYLNFSDITILNEVLTKSLFYGGLAIFFVTTFLFALRD